MPTGSKSLNNAATIVGVAAKGAGLATTAATTTTAATLFGSAGAAAAIPYIGWAAAAVAVLSQFFGGSGHYTTHEGYEVSGTITGGNFSGTVNAFDDLGNRWSADMAEFTARVKRTWDKYVTATNLPPIPLNFKTGAELYAPIEEGIKQVAAHQGEYMNAPDGATLLGDTDPTGAPIAPAGSTSSAPTIPSMLPAGVSGNPFLLAVALVAVVMFAI